MNKEILALEQNNTWKLVDLPAGKKPIGCKWVYKVKLKADGSLERCKARLVAKGFNQEYGIDYEETFIPVVKMSIVRCLIAVAASKNWPLFQLDVNNAFLHEDLKEEVYMKVPKGVSNPGNKVYESHINIDSVYVDDVILTGTNVAKLEDLKKHLHQEFSIKDLGTLNYFLGIEVGYTADGVILTQKNFTRELLQGCGFNIDKRAVTPLPMHLKLSATEGDVFPDAEKYRSLVGKLNFLTQTRPDLSYTVQTLNWASCLDSRRFISGFVLLLGGSPISWKSKKQGTISKSSAEAEYRAMAAATSEFTWIVNLLEVLGVTNLEVSGMV
ncbi:uncharacterized protein LOC110706125 [Chenopodium quinoa]|uniref:uncharacterized protein LOC110706125 n=1 Tax=Chenopodium quinoa TaxID=63459 RepID=UPI000B788618|nr:uncharacterized protein LOC110706125 [Chenopodium quinoa]